MKLKKDYWIAIACKIIVILTELIITIFINRGLGVISKGEYSYVMKIVEVLYILCSLGLGQTYATLKKQGKEYLRNTFIFLAFSQSFLVIILGMITVKLFHVDYGEVIVIFTAISVLKSIFSMIAVIERNVLRNIIQVFINVCYATFLGILFLGKICSLRNVFLCYGIAEIFRIVIICYIYKFKPSLKGLNQRVIREIYKVGFVTMILMVLITLNYSIDTVMIRNMSSSYSTGIYSVGVNFASMFLMVPDAFKDVLFGDASNKKFDYHTTYSIIKVSVSILILGIVVWLLFGKFAISILYGKVYLDAYFVTIILFFGCLSLTFFKILQPIFIANGDQSTACAYLFISVLANIIANYFLIPTVDYLGAAIASVISYTVCGLLFLINYKRKSR